MGSFQTWQILNPRSVIPPLKNHMYKFWGDYKSPLSGRTVWKSSGTDRTRIHEFIMQDNDFRALFKGQDTGRELTFTEHLLRPSPELGVLVCNLSSSSQPFNGDSIPCIVQMRNPRLRKVKSLTQVLRASKWPGLSLAPSPAPFHQWKQPLRCFSSFDLDWVNWKCWSRHLAAAVKPHFFSWCLCYLLF